MLSSVFTFKIQILSNLNFTKNESFWGVSELFSLKHLKPKDCNMVGNIKLQIRRVNTYWKWQVISVKIFHYGNEDLLCCCCSVNSLCSVQFLSLWRSKAVSMIFFFDRSTLNNCLLDLLWLITLRSIRRLLSWDHQLEFSLLFWIHWCKFL